MKKFYPNKEKIQEKPAGAFPLNRRHTLMDLGQESTTQPDTEGPKEVRRCASRARSIDSLDQMKGSPDSITLSTASTVVITESELSSSWLYKNRKAAIATPVKAEEKRSEPCPTLPNADPPTILDDPKMVPVRIPTKPRPEKCSSRCCYVTVLIIITLCTLGILSIIGSVIYLELFAAYKTMVDTPVEEKPLMKGAGVFRQSNTESQILKKSSELPVSFGNRPFGEKPESDGRSVSENDSDKGNKSTVQTFLDDISSRITTTLKSQGIIDQSSEQLTEDLSQLKDKLLLSAEETWNASQNLMADLASLFRPKSVTDSDETTSSVSEVEEDLRELSELPGKMLDGFIGRPVGPFPSFNFIPFDLKSDRVERTGLVGTSSEIRNENKKFSTSFHFPSTPQLGVTRAVSAEATPVQVGKNANQEKTDFQVMTNTPSLDEHNEEFSSELDVSVDTAEETPHLPLEKMKSEPAELPENSSKSIVSVDQVDKMDPDEQTIGTFEALKQAPTSLTLELVNTGSATESQSIMLDFITNIVGNPSESDVKLNEPAVPAIAAPTETQKHAQLEPHPVTTHQPNASLKTPVDIKSSLAEAMKHLLTLDVNKNIPSSRTKSGETTKSKAIPPGNKLIGPIRKPLLEVNSNHTEEKSERMKYLHKLRSMMFGN